MIKFKIGDRVKCISPDSWEEAYGRIGTIDDIRPPEEHTLQTYTVCFDTFVDGWDKDGRCVYIAEDYLELLTEEKLNKLEKIYFAKVKPNAIIPSKKEENAGYDVNSCFDQDYIRINSHETIMIPTGIASCCSPDYYFQLLERGSTGTKGIEQRCGVIDSGFRNEWFVPVTNGSNKILFIVKKEFEKDLREILEAMYAFKMQTEEKELEAYVTIYPYEKAICQAVLLPVPKTEVVELSYEELLAFKSERGLGCLGSSNK